jgi:tagatose 6-phosphate kinase
MLISVTPNAAIDRTLRVERLDGDPEGADQRVQAGGKGVNVARALRELGVRVRAVVTAGGRAGAWLVDDLARAGVPTVVVSAPGESRTCLEIVEQESGRVRQEHGPGIEGSPELGARLLAAVERELVGVRWLALCGSLPRGLPGDFAAELVELARRRRVRCAVDTSGDALRAAWRAGPDLVRVNVAEAAGAAGVAPGDLSRGVLESLGPADRVVVSAGAGPALAFEAGGPGWRVTPPPVRLSNPVGCGDAMLAGLLHRLDRRATWPEVLRFGAALGAADAESPWAGHPDAGRARELEPRVAVEPWIVGLASLGEEAP